MNSESNKNNLIRDFEGKQGSYFERNYKDITKENYVRRLRNSIINRYIDNNKLYDNVLDAGCGPAILYNDLLKRSGKYYALDMVQTNLDEIRNNNNCDNIEYILSDADAFEWQENFFDIIICSGSIEYHDMPYNNLTKLVRILKPGGTLICSFPNISSPYRLWSEYIYKYIWIMRNLIIGRRKPVYSRKLFSGSKVVKICENTNLVGDIELKYFGVKALLQPLDAIFRNLDYSLSRYYEDNQNLLLRPFCTEFLLVLKKNNL